MQRNGPIMRIAILGLTISALAPTAWGGDPGDPSRLVKMGGDRDKIKSGGAPEGGADSSYASASSPASSPVRGSPPGGSTERSANSRNRRLAPLPFQPSSRRAGVT